MKNKVYKAVVAASLLAAMGSVQAEDEGMGIGIGVRGSTLGAGIELGKSFSDHFGVRLGLNKYSKSDSQTIDDIDYDADLDLSSTALLFDWHPFAGSFHLTAGYLNSNNELTASATPDGDVSIGDTTVTVTPGDLILDGSVKLGSGPYLGLGWGNVPAKGFGFVFEVGVVQMGTPDVDLVVTDNTGSLGIVQADIDQEIANMEDDLDEFKTYPVIALGISYGF
ncbi:MAG: hypothetical protein OQL08_02515 [Gammaproteobacteria bacterium]|nr:hypothetical protein [Gammaproteobacteria bacterium]